MEKPAKTVFEVALPLPLDSVQSALEQLTWVVQRMKAGTNVNKEWRAGVADGAAQRRERASAARPVSADVINSAIAVRQAQSRFERRDRTSARAQQEEDSSSAGLRTLQKNGDRRDGNADGVTDAHVSEFAVLAQAVDSRGANAKELRDLADGQ